MTDENSKLSKKRITAVRPKLQEQISGSAGQVEIAPFALKMTGQTGNATIMDVARLAGVSKKTVSRVINNSELVQAPTRERVLDAVRQLNYVPDPQARGLSSKHAYLIGMVFDNPTAQYIVSMQYGILDGLRDSGFELVVHPCDSKQANYIEGILQFVKRQRLYGVILIPRVSEDEQLAAALREIGVEYIRIAAVPLEQADRMIVTNDRLAGIEVANYFESLGHRRVALINGPQRYRSAIERGAGFAEGLAARGLVLEDRYVYEGGYTFESGVAGAQQLLRLQPRPTAIFATNDQMAAGIFKAAHRLGISIPEQLSVVGYDDSPLATQLSPSLTSCHVPVRALGNQAARALLSKRQTGAASAVVSGFVFNGASIEPNLVVRDSAQPPSD